MTTITEPLTGRADTRSLWKRLVMGSGKRRVPTYGEALDENADLRRRVGPAEAKTETLTHELSQALLALAGAEQLITGMRDRIAELEAGHVDAGVLTQQLDIAAGEIERLTAEVSRLGSDLANLSEVTVPLMHRDPSMPPPVAPLYEKTLADLGYPRDPDGETTQAVYVSTLAAHFGAAS